jgi:hypothetical protein
MANVAYDPTGRDRKLNALPTGRSTAERKLIITAE